MVDTPVRRLTKLGFRRDVRIFLTALGGFFAVLVAVLLLLLQHAVRDARDARNAQWDAVADAAAETIAGAVASGRGSNAGILLTSLAARHPIAGSELVLASGERFTNGSLTDAPVVTRRGAWGTLRIAMDDSSLDGLSRHIALTTAITAGATAGAVLLLLLYIPRIVRPIEEMLDQAALLEQRPDDGVDEQTYLLDTFRRSVATLREQQEELRRLHDEQKSRADELARMTAALTRGMTSGLLAVDPSGNVVDVNNAGREILRLALDDGAGPRHIDDVLGSTPFAAFVREALDAHAPLTRRETQLTSADGETLTIGVTTVPLLNDADEFFGMLVLFTDLTGIRVLESRLRESQTLADLGEMAAGIAHEFRNSLSTILGYLKLAQRSGTADEVQARVRKAEEEAAQLSAAVESLLAFARPVSLQLQRVDLRALVEQIVARLEPSAADVEFVVRGEASVDGDAALLTRALQNVLRNAVQSIEAKQKEGRIEIDLDSAERTISVRDNGVGVDDRDVARLFLPFHSDKPAGFGLGLPLARKIAVLHGGTIRMTGTPGEGATVVIELGPPAAAAALHDAHLLH